MIQQLAVEQYYLAATNSHPATIKDDRMKTNRKKLRLHCGDTIEADGPVIVRKLPGSHVLVESATDVIVRLVKAGKKRLESAAPRQVVAPVSDPE